MCGAFPFRLLPCSIPILKTKGMCSNAFENPANYRFRFAPLPRKQYSRRKETCAYGNMKISSARLRFFLFFRKWFCHRTPNKVLLAMLKFMGPQQPYILIIEDELSLLRLIGKVLERHGFRVMSFNSGNDALLAPEKVLRNAKLALVDDFMPGIDGLETIEALRRLNPTITTVIMTGYPEEYHSKNPLWKLVSHMLSKPFGPYDLIALIDKLLKESTERDCRIK